MHPKHDTKFHEPVGESPGVMVCENHQEAFREVYETVNGRMSKSQALWTVSILSAIAVFYGVTLWTTVHARCAEFENRIAGIREEAVARQIKLEYIEKTVAELKVGQENMRSEMNAKFDELRREIQRLGRSGGN